MWHRPQQLNLLSNTLFGLCLLPVLYGAQYHITRLSVFDLNVVQLDAEPREVDMQQVAEVINNKLNGNFFTADLAHWQQQLEAVPWVRSANVRRYVPWQLQVTLEEHVALAVWDKTTLVNQQGELFQAQITDKDVPGKNTPDKNTPDKNAINKNTLIKNISTTLPTFMGPPESSAEVTKMYFEFTRLLAPVNQTITQISLSPRRAWQVRLHNGMLLDLGREQVLPRFTRFVAAYPHSLAAARAAVNYVDLRYRNGFAVNMSDGNMSDGNMSGGNISGGGLPAANISGAVKSNRIQYGKT